MARNAPPAAPRVPLWAKLVLPVAAVGAFLLLAEGILALAGVEARPWADDPYVGFTSLSPLFVETVGEDGEPWMETAPAKLRFFNPQSFPREKPAGTRRAFCLGGSTTYGRPYDDATSFCGWLRELLPEADPGRRWEVINAGGISYASYRVAVLAEELLAYEPDLFVVYSGHNEFLERRTYRDIIAVPPAVRGLGALAARTRLYAAMRLALERLRDGGGEGGGAAGSGPDGGSGADPAPPAVLEGEVTTLLDGSIGPEAYTRSELQREKVLDHFRFNLARMVEMARAEDVEIVLVTPASNLRASSPFKSEHRDGLPETDRQRFESLLAAAEERLARGEAQAALALADEALGIDVLPADAHYLRGRILDALGRFAEAAEAYRRARDEDVCPLRALSPVPGIVEEVARERGAGLVDFAGRVAERAEDGIPGADLFLDHVHPTIRGHRDLAVAIVDELADRGVVRPGPAWGPAAVERVTGRVESRLDPRAHAQALTKLSKVLSWAGKLEDARRLADRAVELDPEDGRAHYQAGLTAELDGDLETAERHYRRSVELAPHADLPWGNLGAVLERRGRLEEAIASYRRAIANGTERSIPRNRENLGNALLRLGLREFEAERWPAATEAFAAAAEVRGRDRESLWYLATARFSAGDHARAEALFTELVERDPADAPAWSRLSLVQAAEGDLAAAAESFRRAVALDPAVADSPESLVVYLEHAGKREEAERLRREVGGAGGR